MNGQSLSTLTAERHAAIVKMAAQRGAVRVAELATHFGVSAATIRRDLQALGKQGEVQRVHGGAVAVEGLRRDARMVRLESKRRVSARQRQR